MYNLEQFTARVEIGNFATTLRVRVSTRPTRYDVTLSEWRANIATV